MTPRQAVLPLVLAALLALGAGVPAQAGDVDPVGVWPLAPQPGVERGFDPPSDPWGAGHRGVDLAGRPGQPVRAALPGRVSWAGTLAGRGVVVVDHGATRTTYEPVVGAVAVGTEVGAGDPVGALALAGSHCLPRACLHWGWLEGEAYLDPLRLVGAGPVRLLPLGQEAPAPYAAWQPAIRLVEGWSPDPPVRLGGGPAGRPVAAGRS